VASGGTGTSTHLAGELFKMMAGVDMIHVPYRGTGPAITDLLGGQVQIMFASAPSSIEYIKKGVLRALAVTTATRLEMLPEVPTVGEFVPGYEATQWYGIGAPKSTPAEVVDLLNTEINAGLDDPNSKQAGRPGRNDVAGHHRIRTAHRGRNREVGQGGEILQATLTRVAAGGQRGSRRIEPVRPECRDQSDR
jgi:hypothetical protein